MLGMIYYGLEKRFVKNCSVIILMVEFGWNFTLLGPCTKLFIKGRREKEKEKKRKRSEEEIEKEKRNKKRKNKEKIKKKKNEKGMQFLEGNSCEPLLQRPLACFLNYLGILSFLCFTYSPLVSLQPRLNNQLILDGIVVRMVESQIDDIFHEIFVLFNCSSFLKKKNHHPNLRMNSLDKYLFKWGLQSK